MKPETVNAVASVVNAVSVVALVCITAYYAEKTAEILDESRKARIASETQAAAAQRNLDFLQIQFEEERGLGRTVIQSAIESALSAISYWKQRPVTDFSKGAGFPAPDNLIPASALAAVEHARRISADTARQLSSAFDDLRNAKSEIERVRLSLGGVGYLERTPSQAPTYLAYAETKLIQVRVSLAEKTAISGQGEGAQ
jgi:hypothetical protein